MKIAIAMSGPDLSSDLASVFGRCAYLMFYDTETSATEVLANRGVTATGGAGVEAAQIVVDHGTELLVTPKVGPKAHEVLLQAGVRFMFRKGGTAGEALDAARKEEGD